MSMDENAAAPSDIRSIPMTTEVTYSEGMMGRSMKGSLAYDGKGLVTLSDVDGLPVFSKTLEDLGKVRRAEFALYFKPDGKTVAVMFGDFKKYVLKTGGLDQLGVGGAWASQKVAKGLNEASGLETWVALVKQGGTMGINASPDGIWKNVFVKPMKWIAIVFGVLFLVIAIGSAVSR